MAWQHCQAQGYEAFYFPEFFHAAHRITLRGSRDSSARQRAVTADPKGIEPVDYKKWLREAIVKHLYCSEGEL